MVTEQPKSLNSHGHYAAMVIDSAKGRIRRGGQSVVSTDLVSLSPLSIHSSPFFS